MSSACVFRRPSRPDLLLLSAFATRCLSYSALLKAPPLSCFGEKKRKSGKTSDHCMFFGFMGDAAIGGNANGDGWAEQRVGRR